MSLPPYSSTVKWSDYKIDTPTFKLSPVEKPDMSPYLFHMTGKCEIDSILSPKQDDDSLKERGFLRACIPEVQSGERNYDAEVVCLTESPAFALDFFRYRSYRRWRENQLYGIGFDKSELSKMGAKPCIYADEQLKNDVIVIKNRLRDIEIDDDVLRERLPSLINGAYPLIMPLLENKPSQGFMWEREWRYKSENLDGLYFPYSSIRVICCPENEESDIRKTLGECSRDIEFVRSWREYNEVTSYLKNRNKEMHIPDKENYSDEKDYLSALEEQLTNHKNVFNRVDAFKGFIEAVENKEKATNEALQVLQNTLDSMLSQIRNLKKEL